MMRLLPFAVLLLTTACIPRPQAPRTAPAAPVAPVARPPAAPPVVPADPDWEGRPATNGEWRYGAVDGGSVAIFGRDNTALAGLICQRAEGTILLTVPGGQGPVTVRTTTLTRALPATGLQPDAARTLGIPEQSLYRQARLDPGDALLDAMIYSRGRILLTGGREELVVPARPEIARVVEDCRS